MKHCNIEVTRGTMTPVPVNSGDKVPYFTMLTIKITPDEGYQATHYIINGEQKVITSSYGELEVVEKDMTISALVVQAKPCTITIEQPEHGTLSVTDTKAYKPIASGSTVNSGTGIRMEVTPDTGCEIEYWLINGKKITPSANDYLRNSYTYVVKDDVTVSAQIKASQTTEGKITMIQPEHGTLTAYYFNEGNTVDVTDGATVPLETDVTFHVAPAEGYEMDYWLVNNVQTELGVGSLVNNKTITVTGDLEVKPVLKAKAAPQPETVLVKLSYEGVGGYLETTYLEPGGSGNPLKIFGNKDIPVGSVVTVRAKFFMKGDYQVVYTNNGNAVPAEALSEDGLVYTFTANEDADVHAVFSEKPAPAVDYTITFEAGEGGKVTATVDMEPIESGAKIAAGTQIKILAEPNENYEIDQWL
ncbi:InlB B-repeat-containing protein, partial [Porphyromonas sp.]|uniref:InlB B-repeat-containing protein n=1 Tax=Porphyromonas sp. TaxID=1924944 RepID=UPI003AB20547